VEIGGNDGMAGDWVIFFFFFEMKDTRWARWLDGLFYAGGRIPLYRFIEFLFSLACVYALINFY